MRTMTCGSTTSALLTLVLLVAAAGQAPGQTMVGPRTDCEEIRALFETYAMAQNTGNIELFLTLWDQDAMKLSQDSPAIGAKALEQRSRTRFQSFGFETMIRTEEIVASGDWGYARGVATQTMSPKAGGAAVYTDAKFLSIMKRQPDGHWKVYRDSTSSNLPLK